MSIYSASIGDLQAWARGIMQVRSPDFVIGDPDNPYMRRWWLIPRNPWQNLYLHEVLRSDDDRAGHDHPWTNTSFVIDGGYHEQTYDEWKPWEPEHLLWRGPGSIVNRKATDTHRLIVPDGGKAITLFMTGPKERDWGFWCPDGKGWVHWEKFTAGEGGALVGLGCDA